MKKFWSNDYYARDTLPETMAACVKTDYDGQYSFEDFSYAEGLDHVIVDNLEEVVQEIFGSRFKEIITYRNIGLVVHVHPANRCHIDERKVDLGIDFRVAYRGITDFLNDHDEFQRVFHGIIDEMRHRITSQFPDVSVGMTHRYHSNKELSLQFNVRCAPTMQINKRAA